MDTISKRMNEHIIRKHLCSFEGSRLSHTCCSCLKVTTRQWIWQVSKVESNCLSEILSQPSLNIGNNEAKKHILEMDK